MISSADLRKLPTGVAIPFGTIISIKGEKVGDPESREPYGMFQVQDKWDWFYHTSFHGQEGLVNGADLYGFGDTNETSPTAPVSLPQAPAFQLFRLLYCDGFLVSGVRSWICRMACQGTCLYR